MNFLCLCLVFGVLVAPLESVRHLPAYIKACSRNDPKINKCIIETGNTIIPKLKNGDKQFKLPTVNPLRINEVVIRPGNNLQMTMKNIDVWNLENIKILDADMNFTTQILKMTFDLHRIELVGDYELDGKVLILPIVGNGKGNITIDNMKIEYVLHFKEEEKNNIVQFGVGNSTLDYTTTRIYYQFDNLFNGDERLMKEMHRFFDENWVEIEKELHSSFTEVIATIIESFITQVSRDIPFDEFYIP